MHEHPERWTMRIGLHALGIGDGARPEVIRAVAEAAEERGFARLWAGEHVVLVDAPASSYPYADDGRIPVPAGADWLDPLLALGFAAATTRRIELATGVLLLPEHNPVVVAKQAATLDVLSGGRFTLGVGIGWSAEEFAALGVPFEGRGRRTEEYLAAMRELWSEEVASFEGEFTRFRSVRVNPKPANGRRLPVVMGGNGDRALSRAVTAADGWYGFNVSVSEAVERASVLAGLCAERGRPVEELTVAVALTDGDPEVLADLSRAGVTEVVLVASPPADPAAARDWVADLARPWTAAARTRT
ncbi:LLM class F420-dependent oxidoreductase [Streptomyces erythrochromogenes]|uniref:LLM class F420-dependent oxidoreductase n=1 Tax=Streptomyces erythrochromogenes TaxID=285574 RepID=UPI00341E38A0